MYLSKRELLGKPSSQQNHCRRNCRGPAGKLTWEVINQYVDDMLLVKEEDIAAAMLWNGTRWWWKVPELRRWRRHFCTISYRF